MLKDIVMTVNYPDDECIAAIPSNMTVNQLAQFVHKLVNTEPEATSFVITAVIAKVETQG